MPWIEVIPPEKAKGRLAKLYDDAVQRAGKVYHIVRTMSLSPRIMEKSFDVYGAIMFAPRGLTRRQREMLAVVTSAANDCHY